MKVLVTGCHGLLGQKVVAQVPDGFEVFGIDLQDDSKILPKGNYSKCDFAKRENILPLVEKIQPQFIINAAAYTNVDGAETERQLCWDINVTAVENLVHCAQKTGSKIVHISTDYIFDGENGPYAEDATPNPIGYYGRSKLAAENVLLDSDIDYAIARTMVLYGSEMSGRNNFVTWLIKMLQANSPVTIVNDQIGNTTIADELANGAWGICNQQFTGIVNVAGKDIIDRFTFAQQIAEVFELDESLIVPITTAELNQPASRPLNSGLFVDKAINELGLDLSGSVEGLLKLKQQIKL
jgi:dTDP-4-dehydrorhamnose reductase